MGLVPPECRRRHSAGLPDIDLDPSALGRAGRLGASPAIPLVAELRRQLPADVARWVHFGATSQDVLDTALMLVLRRVIDLVLGDLGRLAAAAAALAEQYRSTLMAARTLLQHASPTTFGRKAAGWLVAVVEVGDGVCGRRAGTGLAVQLGGPAARWPRWAGRAAGRGRARLRARPRGAGAPLAHGPHPGGRDFLRPGAVPPA